MVELDGLLIEGPTAKKLYRGVLCLCSGAARDALRGTANSASRDHPWVRPTVRREEPWHVCLAHALDMMSGEERWSASPPAAKRPRVA